MGTKNNSGPFDCYAKALPDEPMFILLARDPDMPDLVREWANRRYRAIIEGTRPPSDHAMVSEARDCASDARAWRKGNDGKWRYVRPPLDRFTYPTVERLAVVYGDGSISVAPNLEAENLPAMIEICTLHNQTASSSNRLHWARARVARVRVEVVEFIHPPAPDLGAVKAQITVGTDGDANMVRSILGDKAQFFDIAVRARPSEA